MAAKSSIKGFTLVELMVALAVLAIGMSAIGTMLMNAFWHDRHNKEVRGGEAILRTVIENFAAGNPANLPLTLNPPPPWPNLPASIGNAVIRGSKEDTVNSQKITRLDFVSDADANPGTYFCQWSIWVYNPDGAPINRINVVVGWTDRKAGPGNPCVRDSPESCPRVLRLTNYY